MDFDDMLQFNSVFNSYPWELSSRHWKPVTRRCWWWTDEDDLVFPKGTTTSTDRPGIRRIQPQATRTPLQHILQSEWWPVAMLHKGVREDSFIFRCLTRHTVFSSRPRMPRGLEVTSEAGIRRWKESGYAQSPYQFDDSNCVQDDFGRRRRLVASEEEVLSGYDVCYTLPVIGNTSKEDRSSGEVERRRKSLLGNAWHADLARFWFVTLLLTCRLWKTADADSAVKCQARCLTICDIAKPCIQAFQQAKQSCPYLRDR